MRAGRILRSLARIAGMTTLGALLLLGGLGAWASRAFTSDLPADLGAETDHRPLRASRMFSRDGELIGEFFVERRVLLPLADIPRPVRQAFVAAEDPEFYRHGGVRASMTITQQVARLLIGGDDRSLPRRLREALLARRLEAALSKDQILGIHLNHVYLGHGAYGVAAGASAYFGKAAGELTLAEAALLAALPRSPAGITPFQDFPRTQARQRRVLQAMVEQDLLRPAEAEAARQQPLALVTNRRAVTDVAAPYFVETVRKYLAERYGGDRLLANGLRIYTTLDMRQQRAAEAAVRRGLAARGQPGLEGALVALDPASGHLLAMVGGSDFARNPFDHVSQARRPIGSAIDPFIYTQAIDQGMTPVTTRQAPDAPGPITLRAALARGDHAISAQLVAQLGVDALVERMRALGITSKLPRAPALARGTAELGLAELAYALATLPAGGKRVDPVSILRITDDEGWPLEDHTRPTDGTPRLTPETAYIVTDMLRAVIESGTGKQAEVLERPAAGTAGTSPGQRDAWFFGFTPELLCGVWVGRDDRQPIREQGDARTGARGQVAVPIWLAFMQAALADTPAREFPIPPGVVFARANPETGAPAPPSQFGSRLIPFKRGTVPAAFSPKAGRFNDVKF